MCKAREPTPLQPLLLVAVVEVVQQDLHRILSCPYLHVLDFERRDRIKMPDFNAGRLILRFKIDVNSISSQVDITT